MAGAAGRDRDWTDAGAEGQPDLDAPPPGIDAETASEGGAVPPDHPVAVDGLGVTAGSLPPRCRRHAGSLRLVDPGADPDEPPSVGDWEDDGGALSAQEAAGRLRRG
ncbi:MAG TPA: hypothetical protein VLZ77_16060 [Acidimicrobiales bacterium]|nr:hypothetical protein [Acidimicrobiales bacterium]